MQGWTWPIPLIIDINKWVLNYVTYLRNKDQDSIVKQSLLTSIDLQTKASQNWLERLLCPWKLME